MICGRIFYNLFASTLEQILYNRLHKLMERNSETNTGFLAFGINVMNVRFKFLGSEAEFKKDRIEVEISFPTKS